MYGLIIGWPLASKMRLAEDERGGAGGGKVRQGTGAARIEGNRRRGERFQILVILNYG